LIQNDENEVTKQVSTLVALNTFVPLSTSSNAFDAPSAVGSVVVNSISGVISNAFSKQMFHLLQRIFNDKSLRFNFNTTLYNGSNTIAGAEVDQTNKFNLDRTNLNLSIGKSFYKEKLTLTVGSALDFGMTTAQAQAASFQFLPDIAAAYKITPDGRVALTFFYRDSYSYLSTNHTQNSSGTSISYRRDFDRIDELFKGKKKSPHPKKGKKKKQAAPPETPAATVDTTGTKPVIP
jgi:hypothetical protein